MKKPAIGRLQFDVFDLLEAATGIEREGGYTVLRQEATRRVKDEFERLYSLEGEVTALLDIVEGGQAVLPAGLERLRLLTGRTTGATQ